MSDPLVLQSVARVYRGDAGELPVLRGADLTVRAGEIVALVAPSGAGKSTLLHVAGLLDRPDGGSVLIEGRDAGGLPDAARTAGRRDTIRLLLPVPPPAGRVHRPGELRAPPDDRRSPPPHRRGSCPFAAVQIWPRRPVGPSARQTVRRRTAAGRDCTRVGEPAETPAGRRADRQSGCGDGREGVFQIACYCAR